MRRMHTVERVYNPYGPEILSSAVYILKKYGDRENLFISFTEVDKIGINPRSKYDTPLGIYAYPLEYPLQKVRAVQGDNAANKLPIGHFVPFAGDKQWAWILEADESRSPRIKDIGDSKEYTDRDLEDDIEILHDLYIDRIKKIRGDDYNWDRHMDNWRGDSKNKSPGGLLWNITRQLANQTAKGKPAVRWNRILGEDLRYSSVTDLGHGIIHMNEPTQAVFFSRSGFDVIEEIENVSAGSGDLKEPSAIPLHKILDKKKQVEALIKTKEWDSYTDTSKQYIQSYFEYLTEEGHVTGNDIWEYLKDEKEVTWEIKDILLESITEYNVGMEAYSYGADNPELFLDGEPEGDEDEDGNIEWSEEQKEEAAQMAEQGEIDDAVNAQFSEVYSAGLSYADTDIHHILTRFANMDHKVILGTWLDQITLDTDTFENDTSAYLDEDDHINFIDDTFGDL